MLTNSSSSRSRQAVARSVLADGQAGRQLSRRLGRNGGVLLPRLLTLKPTVRRCNTCYGPRVQPLVWFSPSPRVWMPRVWSSEHAASAAKGRSARLAVPCGRWALATAGLPMERILCVLCSSKAVLRQRRTRSCGVWCLPTLTGSRRLNLHRRRQLLREKQLRQIRPKPTGASPRAARGSRCTTKPRTDLRLVVRSLGRSSVARQLTRLTPRPDTAIHKRSTSARCWQTVQACSEGVTRVESPRRCLAALTLDASAVWSSVSCCLFPESTPRTIPWTAQCTSISLSIITPRCRGRHP